MVGPPLYQTSRKGHIFCPFIIPHHTIPSQNSFQNLKKQKRKNKNQKSKSMNKLTLWLSFDRRPTTCLEKIKRIHMALTKRKGLSPLNHFFLPSVKTRSHGHPGQWCYYSYPKTFPDRFVDFEERRMARPEYHGKSRS